MKRTLAALALVLAVASPALAAGKAPEAPRVVTYEGRTFDLSDPMDVFDLYMRIKGGEYLAAMDRAFKK